MAHTKGPWTVVRGEYIIPLEHKDRMIGMSRDSEQDRDEYAQVLAMGKLHGRDDKHGRGSTLDNLKVMAAAPEMKLALIQIEEIATGLLGDKNTASELWKIINLVNNTVIRVDEHVDNQELPF